MNVRRVLIAAAGALLLAGCASGGSGRAATNSGSSSAAGGSKTTVVRSFSPYTAAGKLTVGIKSRTEGHCWETSLAAPDSSTYRCLAQNRILDPCFASPTASPHHATSLACVADPWSKAVLLHVHRLPRPTPLTTRPWAVVLASGQRCVAATGTAAFVAGVALDYTCAHGVNAALRDADAQHVRALVGHVGGHSLAHTTVQTIWRG